MKLSVEDGVIRRPLSHKTLLKLKNFVHRIRILIDLARELITCEYLTSLVIDRRRNEIGLPLWLGDLVEPYFYTTLLEVSQLSGWSNFGTVILRYLPICSGQTAVEKIEYN